jgi:hypothetical protein
MHELTMTLAAARLDEAGGLQSANQFTPTSQEDNLSVAYHGVNRGTVWGRL